MEVVVGVDVYLLHAEAACEERHEDVVGHELGPGPTRHFRHLSREVLYDHIIKSERLVGWLVGWLVD